MGHVARILAALAILAAGSLPLAAFDGPTQTTGPKKKAAAAAKPADEPAEKEGGENDKQKVAVLAQRALEAGIKLYESGKSDEARENARCGPARRPQRPAGRARFLLSGSC